MTLKKSQLTVVELEALIREHKGNLASVARYLGYRSRGTIHARVKASPVLQAAVEDARESFVDDVETRLYEEAMNGNITAMIFILKANPAAKRRGWSERTELTGSNGDRLGVIGIEIVAPNGTDPEPL